MSIFCSRKLGDIERGTLGHAKLRDKVVQGIPEGLARHAVHQHNIQSSLSNILLIVKRFHDEKEPWEVRGARIS
jgi:hypothetical protein